MYFRYENHSPHKLYIVHVYGKKKIALLRSNIQDMCLIMCRTKLTIYEKICVYSANAIHITDYLYPGKQISV